VRAGAWFGASLAVSAAAHVWVLRNADAGIRVAGPSETVATVVELVEEAPPAPSDLPPPPPEPPAPEEVPPTETAPPEPPPPTEDVLATESPQAPPAAPPAATPAPSPRSTPKPAVRQPAAAPSPPPARPAVADRATPVVHRNSPPRYPEFARRKGWEGRVVVRVTVDATGRAMRVKVQTGSGFAILDQAAVETVKGWRFHPKVTGGNAVEGAVDVPVNFSLRGK